MPGKTILILGYGKEGQSTYSLLRSWFPDMFLTISDRNENLAEAHPALGQDENLGFLTGMGYLDSCEDFDLIIKSPGIPYELVTEKCDAGKITSQTDLFLKAYAEKVTGVTGTKGKSTTASLIHHILGKAGRKAILAGNIGIPPLDLAFKVDDDTEVIFEMSSHQLEHISQAPGIAVILNVFPEHLDHYKDFTAYKMAKFNIGRMQPDGGKLVYNADDPIIEELVSQQAENKTLLSFSLDMHKGIDAIYDGRDVVCRDAKGQVHHYPLSAVKDLPGMHNVRNIMAAILVCVYKQVDDEKIMEGLVSYRRLAHRLEFAGTYNGIRFYDDSIATIPEASVEALKTLARVDLIILGGHDRGLNYNLLYNRLHDFPVPYLVFMGEAGRRMFDDLNKLLSGKSVCVPVENMDEAFVFIRKSLRHGDVCLLSPAAASYGMFKDFEERGDTFKKMAATL
ncbi:MAG: UDP-N-acetylmuramoyl-L-alanine--D-glutamate ligase [Bacteroidales bacterium]|nr:UDP-N-acetylmuramoyl-L-alanine--D-glutamate ligase [Bacteroidales bacterium]